MQDSYVFGCNRDVYDRYTGSCFSDISSHHTTMVRWDKDCSTNRASVHSYVKYSR